MTTKYLIASLVTVLLFASCKKELEPQDSSSNPNDTIPDTTATASAPAAGANPMMQNPQMTMTPTTAPAAPTVTAPGMNPPHGQPGHRCDIAVGAPLSSAPAKPGIVPNTAATPGKMTVTPAGSTLTPPPPVKTAPGMNPPHGQEGHRCDIAVGAPLNSAPPTPAATPSAAPAILAAPAESTPAKTE